MVGNKIKGITIELGVTDESKLKLRAISKHTEALADELDAIDNEVQVDGLDMKVKFRAANDTINQTIKIDGMERELSYEEFAEFRGFLNKIEIPEEFTHYKIVGSNKPFPLY